ARSAVPRRAIRRPRRRRARTRAPRLPRIPASDAALAGDGNVRDRPTPRPATAATVRPHVQAILERYELDEEQRSVSEVLQAVASGGLAVAGLEPCLWAGSLAAVRALLVQDGAVAPGVVCDASGWFATSGDTCPLCGGPTRRT